MKKEGNAALFELELELPAPSLKTQGERLIGFRARYERLRQDLTLLLDKEGLERWSHKQYGKRVPLLDALLDRYPLVVFHGDVGTGKTATAEAIANELARHFDKPAVLFKLSTRVRGTGNVGEMSSLINDAFEIVMTTASKTKFAFLIIDEADSLAATRSTTQSHHEDKVAVNTLIQKIDDVRKYGGRVLVTLCTNHYETLDPAILRRVAYSEEFRRPDDEERRTLVEMDCADLGLSPETITKFVKFTGPSNAHKLGYTYSDIRTRILPAALAAAYPTRKIVDNDLLEAVSKFSPSKSTIISETTS